MSDHSKIKARPRLFAALPLPREIRDRLGALPHNGLDARWNSPDDFHITLRFLGNVAPESLPGILAALFRVRRPPFTVEIGGFGVFHTGRQPVLWADVQSTRKLTALAAEINVALEPLGFEMPRKPFRPHITLARLKHPQGLERFQQRHAAFVKGRWQAGHFGLFQSGDPDEKGNRYKVLEQYRLEPGA